MKESDIRGTLAGVCGRLDRIVGSAGKRVNPLAAAPLVLAAGLIGAACFAPSEPVYSAPCDAGCGPYGGSGGATGGHGGEGGSQGGNGGVAGH